MSSYRTIDQGLPPYSGAQQPAGSFGQLNLLQRNSRENAAPRPPHDVRHGDGNESEDWDKDVLGPGEIEAEALNMDFDKCFYEHESTKTIPELFNIVGLIYKYVKVVVYHFFVVVFGIPMALLWAILNGFLVFLFVWIYHPMLRIITMWMYAFAPLVTGPLQAFYGPLIDVHARIFRQIRVKATLNGPFAERLAGQAPAQSSV